MSQLGTKQIKQRLLSFLFATPIYIFEVFYYVSIHNLFSRLSKPNSLLFDFQTSDNFDFSSLDSLQVIYYFWVLYSGKGIINAEQKEYFMRLAGCNLFITPSLPFCNSVTLLIQLVIHHNSQIFCKMTTKPIVPESRFFSRNYSEAKKSALIFGKFMYFRLFFSTFCPDLSESQFCPSSYLKHLFT